MVIECSNTGKEEEECHVKFLLSASEYVNHLSSNALRSHMNILCTDMLRIKNFSMLGRDKKDQYCLHCLTPWKNGNFSATILPSAKKGKKTKRILRKIISNKKLANIETKLINDRHFINKMLVKCLVCKNTTRFKIQNRKRKLCLMKRKQEENKGKKVKKKKQKDNYHGLNPKAVKQLRDSATVQVCEVNPTKRKSSPVVYKCSDNEDDDDIKIEYEYYPPNNISVPEIKDSKQGKRRKRRNRKKRKKNKNVTKNPAPVTPVGVLNMPSSMPYNKPACANLIITIVSMILYWILPKIFPTKKKKKESDNENAPYNISGTTVFLNPYCSSIQEGCSLSKKRKLSKWKRLIDEEERRPINSHSLKNFLSGL